MSERPEGSDLRDEQVAGQSGRPPKRPPERRKTRSLHAQRMHWSRVRRRVNEGDLAPFMLLLAELATSMFGGAATVMPHLRKSGSREHLVLVIDAARPEACSQYDGFLPLERAFWTAYATIPKPDVPFMVAIRPARGWCRAEALAPLFAQMPVAEELA